MTEETTLSGEPIAAMIETAPGVAAVRRLVEDYVRGELITLTEPDTGLRAPAALTHSGLAAVPPSIFDPYRNEPKRKTGTARLTALASFIDLVNRFRSETSALFACDDRKAPALTAVFDYHEPLDGPPAFMRHRATFAFPLSDQWQAWTKADGKRMTMAEFATFIEDRLVDILDPVAGGPLPAELQTLIGTTQQTGVAGPTKLYELATGLKIYEDAVIEEAISLKSGAGQIRFKSEHRDADGKPLNVPGLFMIAIPVFLHGDLFRIGARLRYRKQPSGIVFWYDLFNADRVFDTAFKEACHKARDETALPLFFGAPEA